MAILEHGETEVKPKNIFLAIRAESWGSFVTMPFRRRFATLDEESIDSRGWVAAASDEARLERHCATVLLEWNRIGRDECSCWCTLETHLPTRVVDRALRKVGRSKQHSALMREGLERSLTHASARRDREGPSADEDGEPSAAHRARER